MKVHMCKIKLPVSVCQISQLRMLQGSRSKNVTVTSNSISQGLFELLQKKKSGGKRVILLAHFKVTQFHLDYRWGIVVSNFRFLVVGLHL